MDLVPYRTRSGQNADKGGGDKNPHNFADVLDGWSLTQFVSISGSSDGDNDDDDGDSLFLRGNLHVRIICAEDLPNTDR